MAGLLDEISNYMVKQSIDRTDPKKPSVPLSSQVLSALQGASNAAASNLSAPVDGIAWLLRKAGVPIPSNPVGGSDWMAQQGLTREPQNRNAGLLGEVVASALPMAAANPAKSARGLLQVGEVLPELSSSGYQSLFKQEGALLPGWRDNANKALDAAERGEKIGKVPLAVLEPEQFSALNKARVEYGQPPLGTPNVDYLGRHHYRQRALDGDGRQEMLAQIENGLSPESVVILHGRGPALQNPKTRVNPRGEVVNDRAILNGAPDRFTELFSAYGKEKK